MHNHELGAQDFQHCFVRGNDISYSTANFKSPPNLNIAAKVLCNELSIMSCFASGNRFKEKGGSRVN